MKKIKVLTLNDSGSSPRRVRVEIVLKALNVEEFDVVFAEAEDRFLQKEMLKDVDILFQNFLFSNPIEELSSWKNELGFKYVLDLDDAWWDYSHSNGVEYVEKISKKVPKAIVLADLVTVSTLPLADRASVLNANIAVVPNYLPVGQYSYTEKVNKYNGDKLRVALYGMGSHIHDWNIFKSVLNKLAKNKIIAEKCEFNLLGVSRDTQIGIEFSKKKNLKVNYFEPVLDMGYMELLEHTDVVLQPLVVSDTNICRSGLKILECAIKDVCVVGGELYMSKEFPNLLVAESPLEYEKHLLNLITNYVEIRDNLCKKTLETNTWDKRVEFVQDLFKQLMDGGFAYNDVLEDVDIHQITYKEGQQVDFIQYDNSHIKTVEQKSYLFEWNVFLDLYNKGVDVDRYIGIFSHKFGAKTGLFKKLLVQYLRELNYKQYDFVNLAPQYWKSGEDFMNFTEVQHPGITFLLKELCKNISVIYDTPKIVSFSNFYIIKGELFNNMMKECIIPAIEYMENNKELYFQDAQYKAGLSGEELKQYTDLDFYTYHSFILERVMLMYLNDVQNLKAI